MSQKQSLFFITGLLAILIVVFMLGNNAKKSYLQEKQVLETFEREASSLGVLKRKFGDKKVYERTIKNLNRIAAPSKDFKKGDRRVQIYENLSPSTLNVLLRKIANSTLNIKKLEINRINPTSATVRLEIKK